MEERGLSHTDWPSCLSLLFIILVTAPIVFYQITINCGKKLHILSQDQRSNYFGIYIASMFVGLALLLASYKQNSGPLVLTVYFGTLLCFFLAYRPYRSKVHNFGIVLNYGCVTAVYGIFTYNTFKNG
jgi:hypothetical protein